MNVNNASELQDALDEDRDAVYEVLAEGIANSIQGVDPANVTVFDVQIEARRLLDELEGLTRRLADVVVRVSYVIHLDNQEAVKGGVTPESVAAQLASTAATEIPEAFAVNSEGYTFNFKLNVTSVQAQAPAKELVEQKMVPTVTSTTTATVGIAALESSEGGAVAASAGIIVAVCIVIILLLACLAKFLLDRKNNDAEPPKIQTMEGSKEVELDPHHIVWQLDQEQDDVPAPAMDVGDHEEELPTPVLQDGSIVEYFSRTHSIWLPGKLQVIMTPGTLVSEPEVVYHVHVNTGGGKVQLREKVPLDNFRAPFAEGEPVEVLSRSAQKWLPAVVEGYQASPTFTGYVLTLTDAAGEGHSGKVLQKVSANHVRRRFDEGSLVSHYIGPADGFEAAMVGEGGGAGAADFGPGLTGPAPSNASVYSNLPPPAATVKGAESWDTDLQGAAGKPNQSSAGTIPQWSMVKCNIVSSDSKIEVPSYSVFPLAEV